MTALIDVHTHYFPPALAEAVRGRQTPPDLWLEDGTTFLRYGTGQRQRYPITPSMSDVDAKLVEMDRTGIDRAVLSVNMPGADGLGDDAPSAAMAINDAMAAAAAKAPRRLSWMATVALERPDTVASEMRRASARGACGVMIGSNVAGRAVDLDLDQALFETASDLGLAIMIHPSYPLSAETVREYQLTSILGFLFDTTTLALRLVLGGLFDRYPQLKLVVSHVGGLIPFIVGRVDFLSMERPGGSVLSEPPSDHLRRLFVDGVCLWPPALRLGVEFFGADHVLFGSDHGYWPMDRAVATLREARLAPGDEAEVRGGAATRVFGLGTQDERAKEAASGRDEAVQQPTGVSLSEEVRPKMGPTMTRRSA